MTASIGFLTFDCVDPERMATFWEGALGYERNPKLTGDWRMIRDPNGTGIPMLFQKVEEPKSLKNRFHPDVRTDDYPADIDRLIALGASRSPGYEEDGHTVMLDPEGNEFCLGNF